LATPPAPPTSQSIAASVPSRGSSPGGTSGQGASAAALPRGQQPARASSAPRVSGLASGHQHPQAQGGSALRTNSQPMQAGPSHGYHPCRHPGSSTYSHVPGSPGIPEFNMSMTSPGQRFGYGHPQQAVLSGSAPRSNSPSGISMLSPSGAPVNSARGMGPSGSVQRNSSPLSAVAPTNNLAVGGQGSYGGGGGQRSDLLNATWGRSPPAVLSGPSSGPSAVRAPRAATPGALVKGLAAGIHVSGGVSRNSFSNRGGPMVSPVGYRGMA